MGWMSNWLYGVDTDAEQKRGDDLDKQLKDLNSKEYAPGGHAYEKIADEQGEGAAILAQQKVLNDEETGATGDVNEQVNAAFLQGLKESVPVQAASGAISAESKISKFAFATAFGLLPWYVWGIVILVGGAWVWVQIKPFVKHK